MSLLDRVAPGERGVVRVFTIDLPESDLAAFAAPGPGAGSDGSDWPLRRALGVSTLDPDFVEVFPVRDLDGIGLVGYLTAGQGVAPEDIAPETARLKDIRGQLLVITSRAFRGVPQRLDPQPPLVAVGAWREAAPETPLTDLSSDGARAGEMPKGGAVPEEADATPGRRRVPVFLFLVVIKVLVLLLILAVMS